MGSAQTVASQISPYFFPTLDSNDPNGFIPSNRRGAFWNDAAIIKAQYQKNFGSSAYARIYGYSFYSDWFNTDPNTISPTNISGAGLTPDYELSAHTRGVSFTFADQINARHLVEFTGFAVHSSVNRFNNQYYFASFFPAGQTIGLVVNGSNPNDGICYTVTSSSGIPVDCFNRDATHIALPNGSTIKSPSDPAFFAQFPNLSGSTCGTGPCELLAVDNGMHGLLNRLAPTFAAVSFSDSFNANDRLQLNAGLRFQTYRYAGADTDVGARPFWFAAWNASFCASTAPGSEPFRVGFTNASSAQCPAGTVPATLTNAPANYAYHVMEPRLAAALTVDPLNVLHFSYGRYSQPANTASEQYDAAQQDLAALTGIAFYPAGYRTPGHDIPPEISNNYDLSWEHRIRGTSLSWKITPYVRTTNGEQTSFLLNATSPFVSVVPVGNLTSKGVELALNLGEFSRSRWAAQLAFTYSYTTIMYATRNDGGTPVSVINDDIAAYNAFTSACAAHPKDARCLLANGQPPTDSYTGTPIVASPCYTTTGTPSPCGPGTIGNPYWNAPVQSLFDLHGPYVPSDPVVATTGFLPDFYAVPYVASLLVSYKWNHLTITPALQFEAGQRYGVPETTEGIDPMAGCSPLGPLNAHDPRYTGGTAGQSGNAYDATTCAGGLRAIPDPYTGKFDGIGDFTAPSQLLAHFLMSYDVTPKIALQLTAANLFSTCFGGTRAAWTGVGSPHVCSYGGAAGAANPVGNFYNPGSLIQPRVQYPYLPQWGAYGPDATFPFTIFLDASIKL
jgi:hypothetical protein